MPFMNPTMPKKPEDDDLLYVNLWRKSVGYQKQQHASELLKRFGGAIATAVNAYSSAPLPRHVLETHAKRLALEAIGDYRPNTNMKLNSFIITRIKQGLRPLVIKHQNVARISDHRIREIGPYQEAETTLQQRFGREPTADEVADHLSIPVSRVTKLRRSLHNDLFESGSGALTELEQIAHDPDFERVMVAYFQLTQQEKQVFDYSMGTHGRPKLKPGEVAKRVGVSNARLSQIKKKMATKLEPYLG